MTQSQLQEHFDTFYEDIFIEISTKYGEIEAMNICENLGDHLLGNVYIRFSSEEEAGIAVEALNQRFYSGRPLYAELSPVTEFREACCRQNENGECTKGGFCNFMHPKEPTPKLKKDLFAAQREMSQRGSNSRPTAYEAVATTTVLWDQLQILIIVFLIT
ncbi:hypothetical protein DI09_64p70 [Mitosporidium daphniae]|uniref:Uncharacterized protein n=1 Tax=Mitosporidium daphniae TaxID=1485682 RepID=A0A098VS51_9MICR|nr:uncharacterized protein DI09_64p70 [Mitosporidium daphniae]KGG50571.1 hypothetical protein DI09_64p70 [Mitosporidium daphniae]|eukprot:XP_013237010.1 uncharacterized protein DI09_64p70 [Mitosporidium daphniae]